MLHTPSIHEQQATRKAKQRKKQGKRRIQPRWKETKEKRFVDLEWMPWSSCSCWMKLRSEEKGVKVKRNEEKSGAPTTAAGAPTIASNRSLKH